MGEIHEGRELDEVRPALVPHDRDARFQRSVQSIVPDERVLAIAAHGVASANRDLLEGEQRVRRELQIRARDDLGIEEG